ncbi:MAG: hypothetical protein ACKOWI_05525 [Rhodoluna sp.]
MSNGQTFRPRSGYFFAGGTFVLCLVLSVTLWLTETPRNAISGSLWALVLSGCAYLIFIRPKVQIFDEGVVITNPLTTIGIGWHRVIDIDVRYSLTIVTATKKISAWAAVAPGRYHGRTVHPSELRGYKLSNSEAIRPGESPRTSSGEAAQLCRLRLEAFNPEAFEGMKTSLRFNTAGITALAICAIAALIIQGVH